MRIWPLLFFLKGKISGWWRKFCTFAHIEKNFIQGTFIYHPEWTDPVTVLCSNSYTQCRWLLQMLKPTKATAKEFIKKSSKFTLVPLEWWRPCLRADLPASSSLHIVCDIAEKTKHLPEFKWSTWLKVQVINLVW